MFARRIAASRVGMVLAVAALTPLVGPATNRSAPTEITAAEIDALEGADKLFALIDGVVARQRSVIALKADFCQTKHSSLLIEALESTGEFSFRAPDRVRWDFAEPEPMVVLFNDDVMTTFLPEQRRAERVKLSRRHRRFVRVLAGTQPLDDLASQFRITLSDPGAPAPYRMTLDPTHVSVKKRLSKVYLEVDRELLLPVVVEYHEIDGDSTRYEFRSMELNPSIEESHFELDLGEDVVMETLDISSGFG